MSNEVDQIMDSIATAKNPGGFADKLAVGRHAKLILKRYILKPSQKNEGMFIEAEFIVEESTVHQRGETRGWAWFVQKPSFNGEAERGRNRIFVEAVKASLGDDRDVKAINSDMISPSQKGRGLQIACEVTQLTNPDGSPKLSKGKQNPIFNANWRPVLQTLGDLANYRSRLDALEGPALPSNQAPAYQQPAQPAAQAPWGQPPAQPAAQPAQPPWGQPPAQPAAQPPWGQQPAAPAQPAQPAQAPWGQPPAQPAAQPAAQPPWGQPPTNKPPGTW